MDIAAPPKQHVLPTPVPSPEHHNAPAPDVHPKQPPEAEKPKEHMASVVPQEEPEHHLTVQQAPLPTDLLEDADQATAAEDNTQAQKAPKKSGGPGAPVGIVVVTIFTMLALSALAVMIYLTSQSS